MSNYDLNGQELETLLDSVEITLNKNAIPFDELPPTKTSGVRIGPPAITTRGFKEEEAAKVAELIVKVAENQENQKVLGEVKAEVRKLADQFPLYQN